MPDPGTGVVFLHAFPLNASMWAGELDVLPASSVLAPDFPGFGGTPPGSPSLDHFAEVVVEHMQTAGMERAVVVGLSMGGYVALRLQARWPERVAGLVLADTRAGADDQAGAEARTAQAERVRREGVDWLPGALLPGLLGETTRRERPQVVEAVRRMIEAADPEGVARALLAMRDRPDSVARLPDIPVPVLALAGAEDTLTPEKEARLIAEGAPHGTVRVIPRAGHLSNLENPQGFREAIRSFSQPLLQRR